MLYQLSHVRVPIHLSNSNSPDSTPSVGIDIGARTLHAVGLDGSGRVTEVRTFDTADLQAVVDWVAAAGAGAIAVDSPDRWSTAPHAGDPALRAKFRTARCGEIGLGQHHRLWVPWTAPCDALGAAGWMRVGVALFETLRAAGRDPIEVYPYAAFRVLNRGRPLASKRTVAGRSERRELLHDAGVGGVGLLGAGHDALDAAAAALTALHRRRGVAEPATCGHDGTAIWLPAQPAARPPEPPEPPSPSGVAEPAGSPVGG